jgi:hypothetical protein
MCKSTAALLADAGRGATADAVVFECLVPGTGTEHTTHMAVVANSKPKITVLWHDEAPPMLIPSIG